MDTIRHTLVGIRFAGHSQEYKIADKRHAQQADVQLVLQFQEELRHAVHPQLQGSHSMRQHRHQQAPAAVLWCQVTLGVGSVTSGRPPTMRSSRNSWK